MKYKHVLALNPYFGDSTAFMGMFPPTGLEYIVASMKDLVGEVTLLDLRYEKPYQDPKVLGAFIRNQVDLLCVSIQWHTQFEKICNLISQLPHEVTTVVGGYQATLEVEHLFEHCPNIDIVVRGEGEEIIKQIVTGVPYEDIRGISYRQNGTIVHNENQVLPDLKHIAYPDRSLRRHDYYCLQGGVRLAHRTFDTILTTRGCPFKCKFCTFSLNPLGQKREYTERPIESVIEELKTVTADVVLFSDDNMFTNIERSEKLCDLIIENNIKKIFIVQARIDIARHRRLLDKVQQAGFKVFLIGVESPHDRILNQLQKGITQQQIRDSMAVLTQYDVFAEHKDDLKGKGIIRSVFDPACGTGGMLTIAKEHIQEQINPNVEVVMYGQELNEQTYAIAKSDVLIMGEESENIQFGSSFSEDKFQSKKFDFMLSNPPFGVSWKKEQGFIENESNNPLGRFSAGLPRISDGALLFLQHMISKMESKGSRIAIIFNGSQGKDRGCPQDAWVSGFDCCQQVSDGF